jgi:c-di-GMP-binding flagellar brake protein YcgR
MDVGTKATLRFPFGAYQSRIRGWKVPEVVVLDVPEQTAELRVGSPCRMLYVWHGNQYAFDTEILGVFAPAESMRFLVVSFPKNLRSWTVRAFPRVKVQIPAWISHADGRSVRCLLLDIGQGGCRIEVTEGGFRPGEGFTLSATLPNEKSLVDVPCAVKKRHRETEYGVQFGPLDRANAGILEELIRFLTAILRVEGVELSPEGMVGDIRLICLADLFTVLSANRGSFEVFLRQPAQWGRVFFHGGELIYGETSGAVGSEAVFDLLSWPLGTYRIEKAERIPERNVDMNLVQILLEFAYRQDGGTIEEVGEDLGPGEFQ